MVPIAPITPPGRVDRLIDTRLKIIGATTPVALGHNEPVSLAPGSRSSGFRVASQEAARLFLPLSMCAAHRPTCSFRLQIELAPIMQLTVRQPSGDRQYGPRRTRASCQSCFFPHLVSPKTVLLTNHYPARPGALGLLQNRSPPKHDRPEPALPPTRSPQGRDFPDTDLSQTMPRKRPPSPEQRDQEP